MSSCGKKKNTETVAQYRKRCGGRPLGMIQKVSEEHTCHDCGQPIDINEAGFKFVIRNKKKIKKLICPPGTKSKGRKKCVRMASKERIKRAKGLKVTRRKAKGKLAKTLRKRAKSMKKRKGMGLSESLKLEELVGKPITEAQFDEAAGEKDACYRKVKARYDVWPSAYASGALVKCRKVGAKNWGNSKKESLDIMIEDELSQVLDEKKKKACKPSKGKRFAKRVDGKCRSYGQKGQAKGGGDRIRPGTKKGDAYCARSAKIKKCKNPPCANALSRKKWKCRGSKSMKE